MSNIPKARRILHRALTQHHPHTIHRLIRKALLLMKRRPYVRKGREKADPMSPAMAAQIRAYAKNNPTLLNREIGLVFNVDGGRVSEVLSGRKFAVKKRQP